MSLIENAMLFVDVVQAGSFTKAALRLSHSKSQISRKIATLEQQLDATLVMRTPRGIQLTEQGEQFYQSCLKVNANFEHAKEVLRVNQQSISGHLAITAPISLGSLYLGPLLSKFMKSFDTITTELDLSDNAKNLTESHFDIAIRAASKLPDSNLRAKKLFTYDYAIVASAKYLAEFGCPQHPLELQNHRAITCITTASKRLQSSWPFIEDNQRFDVELNKIAQVTHMWIQKQLALEGVGIIRVPRYWVKEEIESGMLTPLLAQFCHGESHLFALYKNAKIIPARITRFIEFLSQHLPPLLSP
jgi:DNA-binding transcriptional LysR family regulator